MFRFGELNVDRVRRILAGDTSPEAAAAARQAAAALPGLPAPHGLRGARASSDCIVAGDIGCYTLGVLPPFEAMDSCVCMGASIGVGLGLRHVLPPERGPPRRQRHRRQHLRPQRHHGPGGDGLQPAADRPRGADPRQRHHRHDRPAGASRHRPHAGPRADRPGGLRGPGPRRWASRTSTSSTRSSDPAGFEQLVAEALAENELARHHRPPAVPAGRQSGCAEPQRALHRRATATAMAE